MKSCMFVSTGKLICYSFDLFKRMMHVILTLTELTEVAYKNVIFVIQAVQPT